MAGVGSRGRCSKNGEKWRGLPPVDTYLFVTGGHQEKIICAPNRWLQNAAVWGAVGESGDGAWSEGQLGGGCNPANGVLSRQGRHYLCRDRLKASIRTLVIVSGACQYLAITVRVLSDDVCKISTPVFLGLPHPPFLSLYLLPLSPMLLCRPRNSHISHTLQLNILQIVVVIVIVVVLRQLCIVRGQGILGLPLLEF